MKVNVTAPIIGYDGDPIHDEHGKEIPLLWAIRQALNNTIPGQPMTPEQVVEYGSLSLKCHRHAADGFVDLDDEDRVAIRKRSALYAGHVDGGPMVHLAVLDALKEPGGDT